MPGKMKAKGKPKSKPKSRGKTRSVKANVKKTLGVWGRYNDPCPFPVNYWCNFVYTDILLLTAPNTGLVGTTYKYSLNGLHDVYVALGGHQPYGFDQLINSVGPYYRYKVWGVQVELVFYDPGGDLGLNCCGAVHNPVQYSSGATISGKSITELGEMDNTVTRYITSTGSQRVVVKKYFPMHMLFQVTKSQFANDLDTSTGSNAGNPSSQPVLELGLLDTRLSGSTCQVKVTLTYRTQCYDRVQMSQS